MTKLWVLAASVAIQAPLAFDLSGRAFQNPAVICDLDLNVLKGEMRRLSWAPNGESLHIQTHDPRNGDL